jgi:hypothetical protein
MARVSAGTWALVRRTLQFGISCLTVAAMPAIREQPPVQTKIASRVWWPRAYQGGAPVSRGMAC